MNKLTHCLASLPWREKWSVEPSFRPDSVLPVCSINTELIEFVINLKFAWLTDWILLRLQRRFYGPRERKMGLLAFMRLGVWLSGVRAFRKGFIGNVLGEGFVLGGVFVIGRGQQVNLNLIKNWHKMRLYRFDLSNLYFFFLLQGILLEHREKEFGDKVNISDVLQAVRKIQQ